MKVLFLLSSSLESLKHKIQLPEGLFLNKMVPSEVKKRHIEAAVIDFLFNVA